MGSDLLRVPRRTRDPLPGRLGGTVLAGTVPDVRTTAPEPYRRCSRRSPGPRMADEPRGSLPRAMSPLRGPDPLGLRARARRKLPDNRPAPGETGRWLLLGPLRPKDPDPTLRHACYVRL